MSKNKLDVKFPLNYSQELKYCVNTFFNDEEMNKMVEGNDPALGDKIEGKLEAFPSEYIIDMIEKKDLLSCETLKSDLLPLYNQNLAFKKWKEEMSGAKSTESIKYSKGFVDFINENCLGENTSFFRDLVSHNDFELGYYLKNEDYMDSIDFIIETLNKNDEKTAIDTLLEKAYFQIYAGQVYDIWKDEYEKFIFENCKKIDNKKQSQPGENK